jgi:hypothetical protein
MSAYVAYRFQVIIVICTECMAGVGVGDGFEVQGDEGYN